MWSRNLRRIFSVWKYLVAPWIIVKVAFNNTNMLPPPCLGKSTYFKISLIKTLEKRDGLQYYRGLCSPCFFKGLILLFLKQTTSYEVCVHIYFINHWQWFEDSVYIEVSWNNANEKVMLDGFQIQKPKDLQIWEDISYQIVSHMWRVC